MIGTLAVLWINDSFKTDSEANIEIPFFTKNFSYHNELMKFVQFIFNELAIISVVCTDITLAFFVFSIMGASEILYEYISTNINSIQVNPDLFKIITRRYCEIVECINLFNNIYSIMSFVQFISSAFLSFVVFFIVRLDPMDLVGYAIVLCILSQYFIPCLFGELFKIKMKRLSTAMHFANWYDFDLKDQKYFLLILGMIQKEYGLKAAGMYEINIYVFIDVKF